MNSQDKTQNKIQRIKHLESIIKQSKVNLNQLLALLKYCEVGEF
jgi:hypothetical protein